MRVFPPEYKYVCGACVCVCVCMLCGSGPSIEIGCSHSAVVAAVTVAFVAVVALFGVCFPELVDRFALHSLVYIGCMSKCFSVCIF